MKTEGYVNIADGKVWYQIHATTESKDKVPLIVLHGGPGLPHNYMLSLSKLGLDRPIIFYDQFGCGKSFVKDLDKKLWILPRFVSELHDLVHELKLDRFHLLGHSWGGLLAAQYVLTYPNKIEKLILASPLLSTPLWLEDAKILLSQLPENTQKTIMRHEQSATTDSDEYQGAIKEYSKLLCRVGRTQNFIDGMSHFNPDVYQTMWGPSEFTATDNLKSVDIMNELSNITMPTLVSCGRFDSASPKTMQVACDKLKSAQLVIFENSAHVPHIEEADKYISVGREFLK